MMSKGKEVIGMGSGVEDDDENLGDGGRKRKSRSPNQEEEEEEEEDSSKRLKIDLNHSPNQEEEEEEDSSKRLQIDLNHSPNQEEEAPNPNPDSELLFEKKLTRMDVSNWQLIISGAQRQKRVLKALREDKIKKARENDGLSVAATDADGVEYTLILQIARYMTLAHQWTNIIGKYKPKPGDSVHAFASRAADHLLLRLHFITN